jgi:hypothetical protein
MKNQINVLNIAGAVTSASLIVLMYFLPPLNAFSLAKKRGVFKTPKIQIRQKLSLAINKKFVHSPLAYVHSSPNINQEKKIPKQTSSLEIQKQEDQTKKLAEKCEKKQTSSLEMQKQEDQSKKLAEKCEKPSESNGCPKKLDYFTKRPRPKQTPEECFSCRNLITCVCLTDK